MNRIEKIFQNTQGALIVCDCCGAPTMSESAERLDIILKNGADIVELYLPFSDPMADGAVLQAASQQALANGSKLEDILNMIRQLRKNHPEAGFIVTSYYNIFLQYGLDKLFNCFAELGIDGMHIIDLPYEEHAEIDPYAEKYGVPQLRSIAPSSGEERTRLLMEHAQKLVYCYNAEQIPMIKKFGDLPIAIRAEVNPGNADAVALDSAAAAVKTADLAAFIQECKKNCSIA